MLRNHHLSAPRFPTVLAQHRPAPEARRLVRRRLLVLALNLVTMAALIAGMAAILSHGGLLVAEWVMLAAFAVTLPWLTIGLWNAIIGFALDLRHGARAAEVVAPAIGRIRGGEPVAARVALVMPLRNEDPAEALDRFQAIQADLGSTPWAGRFDFHVLSDTDCPETALREEALVARWRQAAPGVAIAYRRRSDNAGFKAGNIAEFVHRTQGDYDYFLPLDADSTMGADTILRMVRIMEASPEIGMLQSLVTGLPSQSFFTRAFQFGMRHGMRSYTLGSAWWQGDCGPNWGHNVLIRMTPFGDHCMLPVLPGRGPLSGHILSHDQVEAVLMRRAGYEVRVLAEESESHEENPPSLVDFIRRDLRWCQGNMQYFRLLGLPGLKPLSRLQLYLAIQMYLAAPAWMAFIFLGAGLAAWPQQFSGVSIWLGLGFFALLMSINLAPKLMGLGQILARRNRASAYGGRARVVAGGLAEILFSMLIAPAVALATTRFMAGLAFGRRVGWPAQQRSRARLTWGEAARTLWPQTAVGVALAAWLAALAPWALWFAAPFLLSLTGAIPVAVISTWPGLGAWSRSVGLFDIPEDRQPEPPAAPRGVVETAA
ncbi:membrane glycosyltransferase [Rhodovulum iodosum]|uniref:Glucans biosynthesis glucosyltransferase H n=1 Tax=Rhodovulum iodosum TaxID=68291 RepID=A0ABV3XR27_9RHOB|nr:glucans biosynthesis glucosyltransferase MdoH [Rhodovulum robiginosum]RSK32805.1 glucans biosynthesis glucosyltransferase MdoH [Rhodovulum robiginosum]